MRTPTPISQLMAWHGAAMRGDKPAIHDCDPNMGWFKVRLVRGGPFVPAKIWIDRDLCPSTGELTAPEEFTCDVNGQCRDPYDQWVWLAKNPISKAAYLELQDMQNTTPAMQATHAEIDLSLIHI